MIPIPTPFFTFFSIFLFVIIVGNVIAILDVFVVALAVCYDGHRFLRSLVPVLATAVDCSASFWRVLA